MRIRSPRTIAVILSMAAFAMVATSPVSCRAAVFIQAFEQSSKVNKVGLLEKVVFSLNAAARPAA